jgi:hypothetical protein
VGRLGLILLLLGAAGCRTRPLEPSADGGARDLALRDAGACRVHTRQHARLVRLRFLDAQPGIRDGRALRVVAGVWLRDGCDRLGPFDLDYQPGGATDAIRITASVYQASDGDCGRERAEERALVLSDGEGRVLSSPRIVVLDGAPGGSLRIEVNWQGPANGCPPAGLAAPCDNDCQCQAALRDARCIPNDVGDGDCQIPCGIDGDCPSDKPLCSRGDRYVCGQATGPCCGENNPCPLGLDCLSCACVARPFAPAPTCRCGSDCADGQLCVEGRCIFPCTTHGDCPRGVDLCRDGVCSPLD